MPVSELLMPWQVKVLNALVSLHTCSSDSHHRHPKSVRHTSDNSQQICALKQTVMLDPRARPTLSKIASLAIMVDLSSLDTSSSSTSFSRSLHSRWKESCQEGQKYQMGETPSASPDMPVKWRQAYKVREVLQEGTLYAV